VVLGGLIVVVAATIAAVLSLGVARAALASSPGAAGAGYQGMRHLIVEPGQTLWSIAATAEPTADPRLVIGQIMQANSLGGATLYPGEQLWVPAR
jgi:hypothetical protein